jgi:DNA-binding GntR family transcriptional regulator
MSWDDRSGRIDHSGPAYVWSQIADDLRAEIESGALPAGARLPSEPELGRIYGVAKATVHNAIVKLRDEGLLTVAVGRGTFVSRRGGDE